MKWVVISFDEDSKLYTVQSENGRTCRANADAVVYDVEGRKLKSIPHYTDEGALLGFIPCLVGKDVKTTEFGLKLLMKTYSCCSADLETPISFCKR